MEVKAGVSSFHGGDTEGLINALTRRGWCFGDLALVRGLISIQIALHGDSCTVDRVESELTNSDLRSIGGKSLPDTSVLRKSSHLPGPKVLQVVSVRDISHSSIIDENLANSRKRLLRLVLTDGYSEITAIEYSHIPSIASDIVPGTKVRLENKTPIHCGIVCLSPKVITVLGGVVQSLKEEWEMNQKYSGLSRSSLSISKESDGDSGRPPFEKLQIHSFSRLSTSKSYKPTFHGKVPRAEPNYENDPKVDKNNNNAVKTEETTSNSEGRAREIVEVGIPVQKNNQVAAKKLLEKMSQTNREYHSRGRKYRGGKGKEENDESVFTLDEWERRKAGSSTSNPSVNISQDEELARQLQLQFDLADHDGGRGDSEADRLRMDMFNFQRNDDRDYGDGEGFRGRGRGRGRWRGRGRRGRGRGR